MFLSRLKNIKRTLSVRLLAGFCVLFVLSTVIVFFFVYGLFSYNLEKRDHELIESKVTEYSTLYLKDGISGLQKLATDPKIGDGGAHFLVRLVNDSGESLFFHAPINHQHFDMSDVEKRLKSKPVNGQWQYILSQEDDDSLEVLTMATGDGTFLQVGNSSDSREDLLEDLRDIFLAAMLTTILIAAVGGIFFTNRVLRPIRALVSTMQNIQSGNLRARVNAPNTGDELDTLTSVFNAMLDKIQALLQAMKETQDNVAHDLRTPMTRFRNIAELALQKEQSAETYREALSEGLECSAEIITLVNTLMEITEAEAGAIKLDLKPVSLSKVLSEVIDLYELSAEDKGLELKLDCHSNLKVNADYGYLKRVLSNLLDNAIKYTDLGSVKIECQRLGNMVEIHFHDSGIGIGPSEISRIWDRLFRGDKSRSRAGMGLGLSVVRSVVKAHGGTVSVKSELGKGSSFTVAFPAA
ncbi:MAG: sensor histidine kinase [Bdellovibrionota bacterium]